MDSAARSKRQANHVANSSFSDLHKKVRTRRILMNGERDYQSMFFQWRSYTIEQIHARKKQAQLVKFKVFSRPVKCWYQRTQPINLSSA
ncbi:hypothetical protein CYMTET_27012, partial [Cymbomonas tetramitiformis]